MTEKTISRLTKKVFRTSLLARRKQLFESSAQLNVEVSMHFLKLLKQVRPKTLGLYWPIRSEPNLIEVSWRWQKESGALLYLPETRRDCMVYRRWFEGADLLKDCAGISYAPGEEALESLDMVVAPCVGYTESCRRLGYGGGYFDRYLAACGDRRPMVVGVAFDELLVSDEIFEIFDEPLDVVVTERRILKNEESAAIAALRRINER